MSEELLKFCRVCLAEGSQNIFNRRNANLSDTVSSLDRILEKLRFVTMLKIHENECLPGMICDSCIVQLNVAYNFKLKAIESDTKLRQYVIEKGFMPEPTFNLAITDNRSASSASNFIMHDTPQSICDFVAPEPLRQHQRAIAHTVVQQRSDSAAVQQEYLRHFETPQSMASNLTSSNGQIHHMKSTNSLPPPHQIPFRCMPIQIKVEPNEFSDCTDVSPAGSDENLQTVSDTSSVQSTGNLSAHSMVRVNNESNSLKSGDDNSDKEFISTYIQQQQSDQNVQQEVNLVNGSSDDKINEIGGIPPDTTTNGDSKETKTTSKAEKITTKESESIKESKKTKETNGTKESGEYKGSKAAKESKVAKDTKSAKESKQTKKTNDANKRTLRTRKATELDKDFANEPPVVQKRKMNEYEPPSPKKRPTEVEVLKSQKAIPEAPNQQKQEKDKVPNSVTKSGRKVSHIINLKDSARITRVRPSQDKRRKENRAKLTPKKITSTPKIGKSPAKIPKVSRRSSVRRSTKS